MMMMLNIGRYLVVKLFSILLSGTQSGSDFESKMNFATTLKLSVVLVF